MLRAMSLLVLGMAAAAQIAPPLIGYIVDRDGGLRPVQGVAGAFMLASPVEKDVVSAAYSGKSLVVKTEGELLVDGRRFDAPPGPAVISFDRRGQVASVFFRAADTAWAWHDGEFVETAAREPDSPAQIHDGELFVKSIPVRLASRPHHVSQMGEDWFVIYAENHIFAVRNESVYELPEAQD